MSLTEHPNLAPYGIESHWLPAQQPHDGHTLLVAYAHPDDETFTNGGTIARLSAAGVAVHCVCATRGECGTVDPALLTEGRDIIALRTEELVCAATTLGARGVHFLGYRDSGMPGTPDNQHPAAFLQAPLERVTGQLVTLLRALTPQVVVTFGPYGGYGHPDHIHIHRATRAAFAVAGEATYCPSLSAPEPAEGRLAAWTPSKLYYATFDPRFLKLGIGMLRLFRRDPRKFGENGDIDLVESATQITPVTTAIPVGDYLATKDRAWLCYASQQAGVSPIQRLIGPLRRLFVGTEYFTRALPPFAPDERHEHDLFAGVVR
jgi:mycothiol S-conjugate amidase